MKPSTPIPAAARYCTSCWSPTSSYHPRDTHLRITAAAQFLIWLTKRGTNLTNAGQADINEWLANGPVAEQSDTTPNR